ncbi:MAG: PorT family protein [Bacteroidetes bacterium]|uniref:PorT family protein n=1 Tax=Candidatus Cryptobacteroides faecipullorum TaxID=2840764 RepID=A0A9D9I6T7_9BACT|nr:PorT family protein [Candidatus Cryptobacteroides faecipullorum]
MKSILMKTALILAAAFLAWNVSGQEKGRPDRDTLRIVSEFTLPSTPDSLSAYLDTVEVKKKMVINDYSMIGLQYGMNISQVSWNPSMRQKSLFFPYNFGIFYTRYGKMFGYMPYFGFQAGIIYTKEGYSFKPDDETEAWPDLGGPYSGVRQAVMDVIEVPLLAHIHVDFWKMKLLADIGFFVGYRLNIERSGQDIDPAIANSFIDTDRRFDYGIKGGAGFAFVFDPVEIHFTAMYKYSMGTLHQPDYYSTYYYRYSYPSNIVFSVGLHFQLTKRTGMTKHQLRREAKEQAGLTMSLDFSMPETEAREQ